MKDKTKESDCPIFQWAKDKDSYVSKIRSDYNQISNDNEVQK